MLDLVTFHSHKTNVRKARLFEIDDDNLLIDKIQLLLDSFQKSATFLNIRSSFVAAGAIFDLIEDFSSTNYKVFNMIYHSNMALHKNPRIICSSSILQFLFAHQTTTTSFVPPLHFKSSPFYLGVLLTHLFLRLKDSNYEVVPNNFRIKNSYKYSHFYIN